MIIILSFLGEVIYLSSSHPAGNVQIQRAIPSTPPQGIYYGATDLPQSCFQGTVLLFAYVLVYSCLVGFNNYKGKF